jgi:hypothetical protein
MIMFKVIKVKCGTCGLEVTSTYGGAKLNFPDGAETACRLTAPRHLPSQCDAMHKAIITAERAERQRLRT